MKLVADEETARSNSETSKHIGISCTTCCVNVTFIHDGQIQILEQMDGTLTEYIKKNRQTITVDQLMVILQCVRDQMECILMNKGVYTDIKCDNVLYKTRADNDPPVLEIHLGDLDSIKKLSAMFTASRSYPFKCSVHNENDEKQLDYLTTILYIDMMSKWYWNDASSSSNIIRKVHNLIPRSARECMGEILWTQIQTELQELPTRTTFQFIWDPYVYSL